MKSAIQILKDALVGKTIVKREYDDEPLKTPRKITGVDINFSDGREDAVVYLEVEDPNGTLYDEESRAEADGSIWVYGNETIQLKES